MTLLVAGIQGAQIWMVADTAITDPVLSACGRQRFRPKVEATQDLSLVGFAGNDAHNAQRIARAASVLPPGRVALDALLAGHHEYPHAEFAYAFVDSEGHSHLFRVAEGRAESVTTLHLGSREAFCRFQHIRHETAIEHAPRSLHTLVGGTRDLTVPSDLCTAVRAMLSLFASRSERDVGGWPVPYVLDAVGVSLYSYGYSVTDPILDQLAPGTPIPHGTAEAGGFGLSLAELRERDGMVVYWLQRPGGRVLVRTEDDYDEFDFDGPPTVFRERVRAELGREVDIWFGDQPTGEPISVSFLNDAEGRPRLAMLETVNRALSFAWVQNTEKPFRAVGQPMELSGPAGTGPEDSQRPMALKVLLAEDGEGAMLEMHHHGKPLGHMTLDAVGLDHLIAVLAGVRARMHPQVPSEIASDTQLNAIIDPAWRTWSLYHPAVAGPALALRHPGFGWLSFVIPHQEALSLGQWLVEHIQTCTPARAAEKTG